MRRNTGSARFKCSINCCSRSESRRVRRTGIYLLARDLAPLRKANHGDYYASDD